MSATRNFVSSLFLASIAALGQAVSVGCTPADRQTAAAVVSAAAPLACTLVPVFAGSHGSFAGTVCADVAKTISTILAAIPPHPGATAPCARLDPLFDASGRSVGYMCPAYLETAKTALSRRSP